MTVKAENGDKFYEPSRKLKREMLARIQQLLAKNGFPGAFVVRGAINPTVQLSVPRRTLRSGAVHYVTYEIEC